ncbi:glycosyltransferase family 4 protein [Fictibacillus nanhaiensis]|uniref:glycosyltransferase family 4 protein n=1 Tax=Fictibacillus nanhaiensis TaxID=742169 RepID=UPI001C98B954|nr:glycosyltransferase family 4 protein [Fictibacillus nanhaiensis]MBY6036291.1 glycosyltransferase family 4 protein [Fictibacillus nanhaiensis]
MLAELINHLTRMGHDVKIVMPSFGLVEYTILANIIRVPNSVPKASDFPVSDILVSNYYTTVPEVEAASRAGKGKHVRLSLCYEPTFLPENNVSFRSYHLTPHVFVLSKWQQDIILLNHGIKGSIIPVGVSSAFKPLGIRKGNGLNISAVMRKTEDGYSSHREQDFLVDQLYQVKVANPSVKINFITPPNEFHTSDSLQKLKLAPWVNFYTPADDIELNYHLNQTDIFVNSSTYDSASLPSLEAMKTGAAVVTTYAGGNTDYGKHGVNCLMSYRYEEKLSKQVTELIQNQTLRNRIAAAGMQEAQKWTWERSSRLFHQALLKLLSS